MSTNDLDTQLLNIDWENYDWRLYNWDAIRARLPTLRTETIHALAAAHRRNTYDEFSPIHLEQLRRMNVSSSPPSDTPTGKPMSQYFIDPDFINHPDLLNDVYGPPPPPAMFRGEPTGAMYTVSIQLDVAIAAILASGVTTDPHPRDERPLMPDPADRPKYDTDLQSEVRDAVIRVLNDSGVITIRKDSYELSVGFQADIRRANISEYGADPNDPPGTPTRDNVPKHIEDEAQGYYKGSVGDANNLKRATFNWSYVHNRCNDVWAHLNNRGVFDAGTIQRISERHDSLLKLAWFQNKRDYFHVYLPGMRPRYRAWSVSSWARRAANDVPLVPWNAMTRDDYKPRPEGMGGPIPFPEEFYKWYYGRIYTPVVPFTYEYATELFERLDWACTGLRDRFRVHRDHPALELGTVVCIGHTEGFTLLDLKRVVTLWLVLEPWFGRLHRRHRTDRSNAGTAAVWSGGGRLLEWSRLGMAARFADDPRQAPFFPYSSVFPAVGQPTWDHLVGVQMARWVPADWLAALPRSEQLFVHGLWAQPDISHLARAVEPRWPRAQLSLRVRCRGGLRTGMPDGSEPPQTLEFRTMQATLDARHATAWAMVCAAFTRFASAPGNRTAYRALFADTDQILQALGLTQDVIDHFKTGFAGGNEYWEPADPDVSWEDPFYSKMP